MRRLPPSRAVALGALIAGAAFIASALYIPAKAIVAQALLERAWHRTQAGDAARPWPWADIAPVAEIDIPRLHRREIVLEGASGAAMAFGPGHMPNTAAIGTKGTAVVAAHRDTQFRYLGRLSKGDRIAAVTKDGQRTQFRVVEARVVRADASGLDPKDPGTTGARLALVTCYPFSGVLHSPLRYVVIADRDDEPASYDERAARSLSQSPNASSTFPGVPPWRG
jgi:sortase A